VRIDRIGREATIVDAVGDAVMICRHKDATAGQQ
jgi:hypothetical protein